MEGLLDFLVTSEARKKVLLALWEDKTSGSVSDFSSRLNLSYASTHDELKRMESVGLAKSSYVGTKHFFEPNLDHPHRAVLESLIKASLRQAQRDSLADATLTFLAKMGGGVVPPENRPKVSQWSLEEGLVQALRVSHTHPTVARVLPLVLFKTWKHLDFEALKEKAIKLGEKRTLGFFLDLTSEIAPELKRDFKKEALALRDRRFKKEQPFFRNSKKGSFLEKLERAKTPQVAKRWHYTMNMEIDSFRSHFNKFHSHSQQSPS
jgi:hypothetical protein